MDLNEDGYRLKLDRLDPTQESIEALSAWCQYLRRHSTRLVQIWGDVFAKSDVDKQLVLLYLANDIAQNSRNKGSEFIQEYVKILPEALKSILSKKNEKINSKVMRMVKIWQERQVFGKSGTGIIINYLIQIFPHVAQLLGIDGTSGDIPSIQGGTTSLSPKTTAAQQRQQQLHPAEPQPQIIAVLKAANKASQAASCAYDEAAASLLNESQDLDAIYSCIQALEKEQKYRNVAIEALKAAAGEQRAALTMAEKKLEKMRGKVGIVVHPS